MHISKHMYIMYGSVRKSTSPCACAHGVFALPSTKRKFAARAHEDIDDFLCAVCKSKSRSLFSRPLSITYELGALPTVAYRKHLFHGFHYSLTNATVFCTWACLFLYYKKSESPNQKLANLKYGFHSSRVIVEMFIFTLKWYNSQNYGMHSKESLN